MSKWQNILWVLLGLYTILGCFLVGILFVLAMLPFVLILLFLRKIGETVDGMTWEEQQRQIKEKHNASKRD